jgi:hypothetical protein
MSNLVPNNNKGLSKDASLEELLQNALQRPIKEKPYTAQITRTAPTAFVFLLDQSGSMSEEMTWKGQPSTKADVATCVINQILEQLMDRAADGMGMKEYYDVAVIGYGGSSATNANFCWEGSLSGKQWVNMTELRASKEIEYIEPVVIKTRTGTSTETRTKKGWIGKVCEFKTPMKDAMLQAYQLLKEWIAKHSTYDGFPPTLINITDGEATDADSIELISIANDIKQLHTTDGNVMIFNINISSAQEASVVFPSTKNELPENEFAYTLFNMSSSMPNAFKREIANIKNLDMQKQYVAMAYNANASELIQFMNIGTSQTKNNVRGNVGQ